MSVRVGAKHRERSAGPEEGCLAIGWPVCSMWLKEGQASDMGPQSHTLVTQNH